MTTPDFQSFDDSPWLAGGPARLGAARDVPTMMGFEEELMCHWLGARWLSGRGAVVDLGTYVGGVAARIAQGARDAGKRVEIHAYDRFRVLEAHKIKVLYPQGVARFEGDDALPLARRLLAPWGAAIHLHRADLADTRWDGGEIELLVVDASKSTGLLDAIARGFYPALTPGSVVVQRGFLHWREPWVAVQMARLGECLVPIGHATDESVIFGCVKPLDAGALARARVDGLDDAALMRGLLGARELFERFGAEGTLADMLDAIERSPGKRAAWDMVAPDRVTARQAD